MLLLPERCQPEQPRILVRLRVHREQLGSLDVDPSEDLVQRLRRSRSGIAGFRRDHVRLAHV